MVYRSGCGIGFWVYQSIPFECCCCSFKFVFFCNRRQENILTIRQCQDGLICSGNNLRRLNGGIFLLWFEIQADGKDERKEYGCCRISYSSPFPKFPFSYVGTKSLLFLPVIVFWRLLAEVVESFSCDDFLIKDLVTFLGGDPFPKCRLFLRCQFFAPLSNDQVCDLPGDWCVHKLFSLFYYMTPPGVKMGI